MSIVTSGNLDSRSLATGNYGYSAVCLEDIEAAGASGYTLVCVANDVSSSVVAFKDDMEKAVSEIVKACQLSPRADNLMLRHTQFASDLSETHGWQLLSQCNLSDYDDFLQVGGMTALNDATENAISATVDWASQLAQRNYDVNGIVFIITDGMENRSTLSVSVIKDALAKIKEEHLESLISVLIGVNISEPSVSSALSTFQTDAGLTQYIELENADAKLVRFVSQSISSQSSALGTGSASIPLQI
jgi:uncharacterized protein YegL|tara:strand:- start:1173 stop:1910 length:738 start_codon:yes stop_codon:yes gene_type:complete